MDEPGSRFPPEHDQARRAKERLGRVLCGRWQLDALLGVGGMAAVYAATHRNGNRVALKMLHPELSTNAEIRKRFIDEGYVANRVGHPGAVSVFDDEIAEDGAVFLLMDLLDGETLEERVRRLGPLDPSEVLLMAHALLDVLAAAHTQGIVHRDVKPDNIFLTTDGSLRLLDFGIARLMEPGRPHTTQLGQTMGTPAFMPPEQARGRWDELDGRTDLWAVGATMFFALSGRPIHEGETTNEELLSAMIRPAPSLGDAVSGLSQSLIDVVDRALAFEKIDRWPDAATMQAAVKELCATMPPAPRPALVSRYTPRPVASTPPVAFPTRAAWSVLEPLLGARATRRKLLFGVAAAAVLLVGLFSGRRAQPERIETVLRPPGALLIEAAASSAESPAALAEPPAASPLISVEPGETSTVIVDGGSPSAAPQIPNAGPARPAARSPSNKVSTAPTRPAVAPSLVAPGRASRPRSDPLDRRK